MRNILSGLPTVLLLVLPLAALAQGVGIGTTAPDASAALDIRATGQGVLVPRLTQAQRTGIAAPATGLLVYQTDAPAGFWYYVASGGWTFLNPSGAGDNLGNHTASQDLNLQANALVGTGASIGTTVGLGVRADGGLNIGQHTNANILLGYLAGSSLTTGYSNLFVGTNSGLSTTTGYYNIFIGNETGYFNDSGSSNQFIGFHCGENNTTGSNNQFNGYESGYYNTRGRNNLFSGYQSGYSNSTGNDNCFSGYQTGFNNSTGSSNCFNGNGSAHSNTTGSYNQFSGSDSGYRNTMGRNNVFNGYNSGFNTTTGSTNVYEGASSGANSTVGGGNTFVGYFSGSQSVTGSNNTALGAGAGPATSNLYNAVAIGYNALADTNDKVRLGNTNVVTIEGQVAYSHPSDARFKYDVQANVPGLAFITKLRPVTYRFDAAKLEAFTRTGELGVGFNRQAGAAVQSGFLAQEVEATARGLGYAFDGVRAPASAREHYGLAYSQFVVPLVKAVQEQQVQLEAQQTRIATLEAYNATLQIKAAQAQADHAALLALQAQVARLLGEGAQARH